MTTDTHACRFTHEAMATEFRIAVKTAEPDYARQAADAAFEELDGLDRQLSRFVPGSDVVRINALGAGQSVRVSPAAYVCLRLAQQVHAQTGGAFDVTFRSARSSVHQLTLDDAGLTVTAGAGDVTVDLGGIGKGYALDRVADLLREWDLGAALIDAGQSTVLACGDAERQVDLRHPADPDVTLGAVRLQGNALSGSSTAEQGAHIIDPRTGRPAERRPAAWAVAPMAALADALSTAFMVMSEGEVEAYCRAHAHVRAVLCADEHAGFVLTSFPESGVLTRSG